MSNAPSAEWLALPTPANVTKAAKSIVASIGLSNGVENVIMSSSLPDILSLEWK
jgi:hypothetical protein